MSIRYRFPYRKLKEWLWSAYISKAMLARANYYLQTMPDLEVQGWGLDMGCRDGLVTSQIAIKYAIKVVGIDLAKHHSYRGTFVLTDAMRLPFKDETFSLVTCLSLIEHIRQEQRAELYREVHRVLCRGGHLVIQHPNRFFPIEQHSYLPFTGYLPSQWHGFFYHVYRRIPSKNRLVADLRRAGFRLERLDILEAPYLPLSKFLGKMKIFRLSPLAI